MTLVRLLQEMPEDIAHLLSGRGLRQDYDARPACQRNDCLAWIMRAGCPAIQTKRIDQMLSELEAGDVYVKMRHAPSER